MYVCILYGRELVHPLCGGSREPVKTPEMGPGVGVACERRDGGRGEERNGRKGGLDHPTPPHFKTGIRQTRKEGALFMPQCGVHTCRTTVRTMAIFRASPVVASCFLFGQP